MKMTMHIDDALLERVIASHGFASKTEAVEAALREMDRQARMKEFRAHGLGLTPEELADALVPGYRLPGEGTLGGKSETRGALLLAETDSERPVLPSPAPGASTKYPRVKRPRTKKR